MFCHKCGTQIAEGAAFCHKCGVRLTKDTAVKSELIESPKPSTESGSASIPEPVKQTANASISPVLQDAYDRLTESANQCPQIKQISITKAPKGAPGSSLAIYGNFHKYTYFPIENTEKIVFSWGLRWVLYLVYFPIILCDALFLQFFFQEEYFLLLSTCCLIGCIIWFPFLALSYKERNEITTHINNTLGCAIKAPSKIFSTVICILNFIEIGLCIVSLVFVFKSNGEASNIYFDSEDPYIDGSISFGADSSAAPSNGTPATADQLLFQGTPIQDIMGAHSSDIIAIFGEPAMYTENYELDYSPVGPGMYFGLSDGDVVDYLTSIPSDFTYNGHSLDQNFDSLVAILGDDYTDMGGTMYTWEVFWNYEDYQIHFTFSRDSDDDKPYIINIMMSDSETPADDDDYSWVEGDIDDSLLRDQALVGRWRAYDGGSVAFDEYGNAAVSFRPNASILPPDYITWEASNGQIILSSHFSDTYRWELSERGSMQYLTLSILTHTIYARSKSDTSLVGAWDEIGDGYRNTDALVLYADGTGTINKVVSSATWAREIIPIAWWTDDTNFNYEWTLRSAYDYTVSGNTLTIYFSNGSQIYTKVGS